MKTSIKQLVDMYFDHIPYSEEVNQARAQTEDALNDEYEKLLKDMTENEAFETLAGRYGRLSQMAELAGFSPDSVERWRSDGDVTGLKELKKEMRRQLRRVYFISAMAVGAVVSLLWTVYNLFMHPISAVFTFMEMALLIGIMVFPFRRLLRMQKAAAGSKYDTDAYGYLRAMSDRYAKRRLNSIALLFGVIFFFLFCELSFYVFGNSKPAELIENVLLNFIIVEIPLFLLLKNTICSEILRKRIDLPDRVSLKRHCTGIFVFSGGYWLVVTAIGFMMRGRVAHPANIYLVFCLFFAVLVLVYDLTLRKRVTYRNIVVNKTRTAVITAAAVCISGFFLMQRDTWYTQNYINSVPVAAHNTHGISYDEDTGIYTITSSTEDFRILHLTDIHLGGSIYSYGKDLKALKACYALIEHTQPDLVVVTGDMCFPLGVMSLSLNNSAPVQQFAAFMRNTGVLWAFTYGNHDTESVSTLGNKELSQVYQSLSYKTSRNLLYPYIQPDITGRNNQVIELRNADGSLNTALFLIDSNAYTGEGLNAYDYIHDDQVDWYADEVRRMKEEAAGDTVNSLVFFHIPLQEYRTATELYEQGSDEVIYFFGENPGDHGGITNDKVCCSEYPSRLFDTAVELGSTTGFFCGHDHYNNASIEYRGIRLTYGMSIDYLAMPGIEQESKQRGGELITIHSDSTWDLEQIPLTTIQ